MKFNLDISKMNEIQKKTLLLKLLTYAVSLFLTILIMYPFYFLIQDFFGAETILEQGAGGRITVTQVPRETMMTWAELKANFNAPLIRAFFNSVIVSGMSMVLNIYFAALTAYASTAYKWKLRAVFDKFILIAMMIPSTAVTMGLIQMAYKYEMTNKLFMLYLPALATPMTVFFMRMYLKATFSKDMLEAARIDGASEFRIFNQIIFPLMKPAIATQAIFIFAASWNDTFVPAIIIAQTAKKTLPIINYGIIVAPFGGVDLFMTIPPIIVYMFFSKNIVEGVALGSVK